MKKESKKNYAKPVSSGLFADNSAFLLDDERVDDLQCRGLGLIQSPSAFCFGTDSVLLTHFALSYLKGAKRGARIIDLGAGSGVISLLIAAKTGLDVTAVEIDEAQCERFKRTLELNALSSGSEQIDSMQSAFRIGKIDVVCGDYLSPELRFDKAFDHAVCNPPYFKAFCGGSPKNAGATHEGCADIFSIAKAARKLLKFGGSFSLCFPAERLAEALSALCTNSLEPKALRLVRTKAGKKPYLALIRAKHGAKPALTIEDELIILNEDGSYTEEAASYYNGD